MPLEPIKKGSQTCWRWGGKGKVYCGPGAKKKALSQGYAEDPEKFKKKMAKADLLTAHVARQVCEEEAVNPYLEAAEAYISQKQRNEMPEEDFGDPKNKAFPVKDQEHLDFAVKDLNRIPASRRAAIKARLIKIAHRKGLKLPDTWTSK